MFEVIPVKLFENNNRLVIFIFSSKTLSYIHLYGIIMNRSDKIINFFIYRS